MRKEKDRGSFMTEQGPLKEFADRVLASGFTSSLLLSLISSPDRPTHLRHPVPNQPLNLGKTDSSRAAPYTVRLRCTPIAGRQDSPIEVLVTGGHPGDHLELGIGLAEIKRGTFVSDEKAGMLGAWGTQAPEIGNIGLGVIFPRRRFLRVAKLADENQVVLRIEPAVPLRYHIQGDWVRSHCSECRRPARRLVHSIARARRQTEAALKGTLANDETS